MQSQFYRERERERQGKMDNWDLPWHKTDHKQFTLLWCMGGGLFSICLFDCFVCLFAFGGVRSELTNIFSVGKINYLNYQVKYQAKYQIIWCFGTIRWEHLNDDL